MWKAQYFSHSEMACKCGCGKAEMDQEFMNLLDSIRDLIGQPLIITSGYRCPNHPAEKRKEKSGAHSKGKAADIAVMREDAHKLLEVVAKFNDAARAAGVAYFTGIGIQQKGAGRFIHLDTCTMADDGLPRPTIWSY